MSDTTDMNGPQHYREAERLLAHPGLDTNDPTAADHLMLAAAQVHATLALTAATVAPIVRAPDHRAHDRAWIGATS